MMDHTAVKILRKQLLLMFSQAPQTFASSTVVSVVVMAVLWGQIDALHLIAWFLLIIAGNLGRLLLIRIYQRNPKSNEKETGRWLRRFMLITFCVGLTWGVGATLFMQQSALTYQMFMVMILAGVSAGALATYSSSPATYRVFILGCFAIPALWLLLQNETIQTGAGILIVLYIALMLALNRRQFEAIGESLRLRYKNADLLKHLEAEVTERRINEARLIEGEDALRQKTEQLQSLLRLAKALEQAASYEEIMASIREETEHSIGYSHVWIYLHNGEQDQVRVIGSAEGNHPLPGTVQEGSAAVVIEDALTDPRISSEATVANRTIVSTPIMLAEKRVGTLLAGTVGDEGIRIPAEHQLEHLSAMASHVALALDRVRLFGERLEIQSQLEHSQRLDSLGLMAGGIAHDFNNILTSIMGSAAVAGSRLHDKPEEAEHHLSRIVESGKRAADLCNQMLAYSGKGHFVVEMVSLNQTVKEIVPLLDASIGKHVEVHYEMAEELPMIEVDIAQIQQVIMNLVINASEAITGKRGDIYIRSGLMQADDDWLARCYGDAPVPGQYVYLEVADTGCGMDSETASRIFDPFFTTKFTGRGLGMSALLGIVRGHHGAISMQSRPDEGTVFRVLFPAFELCSLDEPAAVAVAAEEKLHGADFGSILVADDEPNVLELAQHVLEDDGFHVLTAVDGKQAVEMYRLHQQEISLVLLDLTMPVMNGIDCYRELRNMNPDVKVILVSGYSEEEALDQFEGFKLAGFIKKPYLPDEMSSEVSRVLSR